MTVKLYVLPSSSSSRKAKKFLEDNNIPFTLQSMINEPLSKEQLFEILAYTENGVDDILSERSKEYNVLKKQGVVFDELSMSELYDLIRERPTLLKAPIMVSKNITVIGYNEEEISVLIPRSERKRALNQLLAMADNITMDFIDTVAV